MSYNHREGKTRSNRGRDKQIEGGRMADRLATLYNRGVCAPPCAAHVISFCFKGTTASLNRSAAVSGLSCS